VALRLQNPSYEEGPSIFRREETMNVKSLLLALMMALPSWGFAQDGTTSGSVDVKEAMRDRREISLSPGVSYTDDAGWLYGVSASVAFPMSLRSQIELGGMLFRRADDGGDSDASGVFGGPLYNFNEDIARAFFLGVGLGYSNIYPFEKVNNSNERMVYGYAQLGKRFALNNSGTLSYKPRFVYFTRGENQNEFQADAINFSYLF